jgi:hypothetical protein
LKKSLIFPVISCIFASSSVRQLSNAWPQAYEINHIDISVSHYLIFFSRSMVAATIMGNVMVASP